MSKRNPYETDDRKRNSSFNEAFDWGGKEVTFYKVDKAGSHALDFIPYKIATKNNPYIQDGFEIGDEVVMLDYWVHRNIGPRKATVLCPQGTLGKPCPICEEYEKMKKARGWDSDEAKALKPTRRSMFNVIDADKDDEDIVIFDTSYHLFTKELLDAAVYRAKKQGVPHLDYAGILDPADAMTVECRNTMEKTGGFDTPKYKDFTFEKRKKEYRHSKPFALDEFMVVKSYDDLQKMFFGADEDPAEQELAEKEAPSRSHREEDEAPAKKRDEPECPHGMRYGKDWGSDDKKCDDCQEYAECRTEFRRNRRSS